MLLVVRFGGDSVSIMLNTLAALFMLELDNLAFEYGLTAHLKAEAEKARAARAAALPKLVAAAEKAEADAKKLVSLALEADVAFEEGQMELKKTLAANMKAEQAKMRAQRLASTVAEMKAQGV